MKCNQLIIKQRWWSILRFIDATIDQRTYRPSNWSMISMFVYAWTFISNKNRKNNVNWSINCNFIQLFGEDDHELVETSLINATWTNIINAVFFNGRELDNHKICRMNNVCFNGIESNIWYENDVKCHSNKIIVLFFSCLFLNSSEHAKWTRAQRRTELIPLVHGDYHLPAPSLIIVAFRPFFFFYLLIYR